MNIDYIGIPNANLEGRYNDMYYFINLIVNLETPLLKTTHIEHNVYQNTTEFDDVVVVPYEKGVVFKFDNLDKNDENNNNTTASLIVYEDNISFIVTKAAWDYNRDAEVQQTAEKNKEREQEIINQLGEALRVDRFEPYEKSDEFLLKITQERQQRIQTENYLNVVSNAISKLKDAQSLFNSNAEANKLKQEQEVKRQQSDNLEMYKKELDSLSDEQLEIIEKFASGEIDQNKAAGMMNILNEKQKAQQNVVDPSKVDQLLNYAINSNSQNSNQSTNDKK